MNYRPYDPPKSDRRIRKSARKDTFLFNKALHNKRVKKEAKSAKA